MTVSNQNLGVTSVHVQQPQDQNSGVASGQGGAVNSAANLTISVNYQQQGIDKTLQLEVPKIEGFQVSDRVLTELEGFLASKLGVTTADDAPWQAAGQMAMTLMLADALADLAGQVISTGQANGELSGDEMQSLAKGFEALGGQANATVAYFSDLMSSGGFPDGHVKFLKMMLEVAKDLGEMASTARMEASQGEFENTMAIAEKMVEAADHTYNEKIKTIDADVKAAWISFGVAVGTAVASAAAAGYAGRGASDVTKATQKGTAKMPDLALNATDDAATAAVAGATRSRANAVTAPPANMTAAATSTKAAAAARGTADMAQHKMQVFNATSQTASQMANPFSTIATAAFKVDAAKEGRLADYTRAVVREMEAAGKMMSETGATLQDLKEVAKKLEAFILNLTKELIAQQLQLVQRANV